MPSADYMDLPFDLAIRYFQNKINLPTEKWDDLWKGMHARAFTVAGAMKEDILSDLRGAVDKAISQGTTLAEFRKDFDAIVSKHGWAYTGGRKWRTATIFNTNLSVAYASGHYEAMQEVKDTRPYWMYRPSSSREPRADHRGWYYTVLPADDPWWDTHYPPNDWGCKCGVTNHSGREIERMKKTHPIRETAPDDGTYTWKDKAGNMHDIPDGIGPGWDYNPGQAAWGKKLQQDVMDTYSKMKRKTWEILTPDNYVSYGRPSTIPLDRPQAKMGPQLTSKEEVARALEKVIGGEEVVMETNKGPIRQRILMNASVVAEHIPVNRSQIIPLIPEVLSDPYEVWYAFERHKGRGQVVMRTKYIKAFEISGKGKGILLVLNVRKGVLEGYTVMPMKYGNKLNKRRTGILAWHREN